eukprot:scaffold173827_cov36-Prasinocladus_malaysianus.AAC.1
MRAEWGQPWAAAWWTWGEGGRGHSGCPRETMEALPRQGWTGSSCCSHRLLGPRNGGLSLHTDRSNGNAVRQAHSAQCSSPA